MNQRRLSRLEQRLTDDDRLIRIAVAVFGGMAVLVLLGFSAREFEPNWCARQMRERRAVRTRRTSGGGCELTFADGTVETLQPSPWAGYAIAGAVAIALAVTIYLVWTRLRDGRRRQRDTERR